MFFLDNAKIAIIGLGYVGLPLAVEFGKKRATVGFDINENRVAELQKGQDATLECSKEELSTATQLTYTTNIEKVKCCNVFIVTVPTPINAHKQPDLTPLESATTMLGQIIKFGDVVIYESTVFPGYTEEVCVPILEERSGLIFNKDFYVGYSPERINPGDKENRLPTIMKITSGSTSECADYVDSLYKTIIRAGTHKAPSLKVAEAAKLIENVQRDVNIALMNELSHFFRHVGISTRAVLDAAGTKWNFLKFNPGLVGGHCISVDPYYLIYKANNEGYYPEIITASRRINDNMGAFVADECVMLLNKKRIIANGGNALIMGLAFKENCPDLRNTKVGEIYERLVLHGMKVDVHDPMVSSLEAKEEFGIDIIQDIPNDNYDLIIIAVAHDHYTQEKIDNIRLLGKNECVVFDVKSRMKYGTADGSL